MSSDCPYLDWPNDEGYFRDFFKRAEAARVPLNGSLELTRRCNLHCVHCYLGPQELVHKNAGQEMTTAQVLGILDQVAEAGCMSLLITGGDPLLRRDFPEIYRHAKLAGLDVTVFTNGTPITDKHIALFQEYPPRMVEITLYGATADTYERITGVSGSYKLCLTGIGKLHDGGIRLGLKTMLMTLNHHEFGAMKSLADDFGAKFRSDPVLNARLDGGREPLGLRMRPVEAIRLEFSIPQRRQQWIDFRRRYPRISSLKKLVECGAGKTVFHIDAYGNLQPCLMLPKFSHSLLTESFAAGWSRMTQMREIEVRADNRCASCQLRVYCGYCPGLLEFENGDPEIPVDYLCELGAERLRAITSYLEGEDYGTDPD